MPSITPLGKRWENLHSFWLLWLLGMTTNGYISFISFFYIGIRARKWKWIFSGFAYFAVVTIFYITKHFISTEHIIFDIVLGLMLFSYITIWVHAFWARKEYLEIIAKRYMQKRDIQEKQNETMIDKETKQKVENAFQQTKIKQNKMPEEIAVNEATEDEIAKVTGPLAAQEIITAREKGIIFTSLIDLIRHIDMKPHELAKCKKHFIFNNNTEESTQSHTDVHSKRHRGRIVDY